MHSPSFWRVRYSFHVASESTGFESRILDSGMAVAAHRKPLDVSYTTPMPPALPVFSKAASKLIFSGRTMKQQDQIDKEKFSQMHGDIPPFICKAGADEGKEYFDLKVKKGGADEVEIELIITRSEDKYYVNFHSLRET
ncbi:hypothetical protein V6N13_127871 [Hibiscus sabdariffa]|uniref:Uncharacterized protein n=1 Tax=Hibiscus sabdariffa TaxID=183260 RepID=A0ABR2CDZ1_9ROSI